jgi:hypothetical protein
MRDIAPSAALFAAASKPRSDISLFHRDSYGCNWGLGSNGTENRYKNVHATSSRASSMSVVATDMLRNANVRP